MKQISIFLENKTGRLDEVLEALAENQINIRALSLAENGEYGILRLIVSNPELGLEKLKAKEFSGKIVEVVAFSVSHQPGSLNQVVKVLVSHGINVQYLYTFGNNEDAMIILKTKTPDKAMEILSELGVDTEEAL